MKPKPSRLLAWIFLFLHALLIFCISAQQSLPQLPGLWEKLPVDKAVHFSIYALLGYLALRALVFSFSWNSRKLLILLTLLFGMLYGLSDEFHQYFVPTRSVSGADWLADIIGTVFGTWVCYHFLKTRKVRNAAGQRF